jgi:hypothetical protein
MKERPPRQSLIRCAETCCGSCCTRLALFLLFVQAKYLKHRRIIVDWMCEVGEEYHLTPLTIHCAVRHLDRILGSEDVQKNRLQLVAMVCVLVAAKYEEAEEMLPTLAALNECSNRAYSLDLIKEAEIGVLRKLGWNCSMTSTIHFLNYFQARGIVFPGDVRANMETHGTEERALQAM